VVNLWGTEWSRPELLARVGRLEQVAGVQLLECADGAERGVRILQFRSGSGFDFEVLVDRGFDIGAASKAGRPLAWRSPVGLTGPGLHDWRGLEWFRHFPGGLVSTCGLDHTLLGGVDDATVYDFPHRQTEEYGLHGRYSGLPARLVGYGVEWRGDTAVAWAEGEVVQAAVFAEQMHLHRRIELELGTNRLRLQDTVTNTGATSCPHMMLYHCNVGFPVVDDGARLVYGSGRGWSVSDATTEDYTTLTGPQRPYVEQCYEHDMFPDGDGYSYAAVVNDKAALGVYQRYSHQTLPRHITWRQLGYGTYVVALEPSTNHDAGRFDARERDELLHLAPGESRRYELEVGALVGTEEIEAFCRKADSLTRVTQ
jgi:hypothetical protein